MNAPARQFESESVYSGEIVRFPSATPDGPGTALVNRAALAKAVDTASRLVAKRSTSAILSNLKLVADGSSILITGTDTTTEITVAVAAAVDPHFAVTVPAHTLKDLLRKAPDCEFISITAAEIETKNRQTRVWNDVSGKHESIDTDETFEECTTPAVLDFEKVNYRIPALPVSDFPDWEFKHSHAFTLPGAVVLAALNGVSKAISTEETRYYLNGAYFHDTGAGNLCLVATDGHRLMKQDIEHVAGSNGMPGVIIPHDAVNVLERLWKGKNCPSAVDIEISLTGIRFRFDDTIVSSRVIDGTFPDYNRVIPRNNENIARFDSAEMLEAVKAVSVISSERGRAVKFEFGNGNVHLTVNNPDSGSAHADFACEYEADALEIGLNARYAIDMLETAGSETVTFAMAEAGSPIVITGERKGWTGVLMPMRV